MQYIKTLLKNLAIIFVLLGGFLVYWYYNDGKLGKGDYFIYYDSRNALKSFKNEDLYLAKIFLTDYDDNYIIALRLPMRSFHSCKKPIFHDSNIINTSINGNNIQYMIVDKNTDKIYGTYDLKKFQQKRNELGTDLNFTTDEINHIQAELTKNKHLYQNHVTLDFALKNCKEDFVYPIIEY